MSSFVVACGGTGGHLSPGIALSEALAARGHTVTLLISHKKVDARLSEKYPQLKFERVHGAPFGLRPATLLRFLWEQSQGLLYSLNLIRRVKPDVIIGFGGFTNAGVVLAGRLRHGELRVSEIDGVPALRSPRLPLLEGLGFRVEPNGLVLDPTPH